MILDRKFDYIQKIKPFIIDEKKANKLEDILD